MHFTMTGLGTAENTVFTSTYKGTGLVAVNEAVHSIHVMVASHNDVASP